VPVENASEKPRHFKTYEIGCVYIDSCQLRQGETSSHWSDGTQAMPD